MHDFQFCIKVHKGKKASDVKMWLWKGRNWNSIVFHLTVKLLMKNFKQSIRRNRFKISSKAYFVHVLMNKNAASKFNKEAQSDNSGYMRNPKANLLIVCDCICPLPKWLNPWPMIIQASGQVSQKKNLKKCPFDSWEVC